MNAKVYIALGTNLGDRKRNLQTAIELLYPKVDVIAKSRIYQTAPWGYAAQPDFLNQVILTETALKPDQLLAQIKNIEKNFGQQDSFRNAPRLIDLDILFYDDRIIQQPDLIIPHARLHKRAFVLVPLVEIAGKFIHPVEQQSIEEILADINRDGVELFKG